MLALDWFVRAPAQPPAWQKLLGCTNGYVGVLQVVCWVRPAVVLHLLKQGYAVLSAGARGGSCRLHTFHSVLPISSSAAAHPWLLHLAPCPFHQIPTFRTR